MFPLHLGELGDDLLGHIARAAQAEVSRPRVHQLEPQVKALAARRDAAEGLLPLAAQVDAKHAASGKGRDDPPDTRRRRLDLDASRAAAPAFGKDHADVSLRE